MARNQSNINTQKLKNDLKQIGRQAGEKVKRTLSKTISDVLGEDKKSKSSSSRKASSGKKRKGAPLSHAVLKAERGVKSGKSPGSIAREFVQDGIGYSKKHSRSAKKPRSKKASSRRPSARRSRVPVSKKAPRAEQSSRA